MSNVRFYTHLIEHALYVACQGYLPLSKSHENAYQVISQQGPCIKYLFKAWLLNSWLLLRTILNFSLFGCLVLESYARFRNCFF